MAHEEMKQCQVTSVDDTLRVDGRLVLYYSKVTLSLALRWVLRVGLP